MRPDDAGQFPAQHRDGTSVALLGLPDAGPVGLSGGFLDVSQALFVGIGMDRVGEDPHLERIADNPRL